MVVAAKKAKATGAKRGRPPLKVPTASQARAGGEWPTSGMAMINEVAAFFRCSRSTVGKMIDDGRIEAVLVGSDRRVIWESVWNYVRKANGGRPRGEASGNGPLTTGN